MRRETSREREGERERERERDRDREREKARGPEMPHCLKTKHRTRERNPPTRSLTDLLPLRFPGCFQVFGALVFCSDLYLFPLRCPVFRQ